MSPEEGSKSPTYNSDSENHHPATVQLRSRAARRSTSVPYQRSRGDVINGSRRASSSSNVGGRNNGKIAEAEIRSTNSLKVLRNNVPSSMVKQMAVNIDIRNAQQCQQPPPLPVRSVLRSSAGQQTILQSGNLPNIGKPIVVPKSPVRPTSDLHKNLSPRVLRPRNTPSTPSITQRQSTIGNASKVISTPNHRTAISRDGSKSILSKTTARTVRFFEESSKNSNETGLKRKRRSFDTPGSVVSNNKSAKLLRTDHTTRSCTWNNQTSSRKSNVQFSNTLCSKKQEFTNNSISSLARNLRGTKI